MNDRMPYFTYPTYEMKQALEDGRDDKLKIFNLIQKIKSIPESVDNDGYTKLLKFYFKYFARIKPMLIYSNFVQWCVFIENIYEKSLSINLDKSLFNGSNKLYYSCNKCLKIIKRIIVFVAYQLGDKMLQNHIIKVSGSIPCSIRIDYVSSDSDSTIELKTDKLSNEQLGKLTELCLEIFELKKAMKIITDAAEINCIRDIDSSTEYEPSNNEQIGIIIKFCIEEKFPIEITSKIVNSITM